MPKPSLERRVLLGMVLAFSAGVGALALSLYDTRDQLRRAVMNIQAREISAGFSMASDPASLPKVYAGGELSYTLYSPAGDVLWYSDNLSHPRRLRQPIAAEHPLFQLPIYSGEVINMAAPLADGATLMVAKRDALERQTIGQLLHAKMHQSLMILLPVCLVAFALIYWMMRWTLKPVQDAARFAKQISPSNLQPIPTAKLPSEMQQLAHAANHALDNLAHALAHEKQLVADAAHELRTPLTVLDLRLQQARMDEHPDWKSIDADMAYLRQLTSQLMLLARQECVLESHQIEKTSTTQLSRMVREVTASMLTLFERLGRQVEVQLIDSVQVKGETSLLQTAFSNVLENALFHGQGKVVITMRIDDADAVAYLTVADEGPGISAEQREQVFVRFYKGSQSSKGAGLGLAITRQILRNLGGDARFLAQPAAQVELKFVLFRA